MDKNEFLSLQPKVRVREVNTLLKDHDLKEVSEMIGILYSTFCKLMREDNYFYHQGDKQYYRYLKSEEEQVQSSNGEYSEEINFI